MALTIVQPGVGGTGVGTFPSPGTAGNVLTSNGTVWTSAAAASGQRYFYAYRTTSQNNVTVSTWVQANLDNVQQSQTSFNTSTYTWTATASDAGVWMFTGQLSFFFADNDGAGAAIGFYYNGSLDAGNYSYIPGSSSGNNRHFTAQNQMIKTISTGDTVRLYGRPTAIGGFNQPAFFGGDSSGGYYQNSMIGVKIA